MAKLTTTDVYGILTAHSNTILKNDVSIAGNLSIAGSILGISNFTINGTISINDSLGNIGFQIQFNNSTKTLNFNYVGS